MAKAGERWLLETYQSEIELEKLDAPINNTNETLLGFMCKEKNFEVRLSSIIKWLISRKCDALKADDMYFFSV